MTGSIYRMFAVRLAAAALVISAVLGGATYLYHELHLVDDVMAMATDEAQAFAERHRGDLRRLFASPGEANAALTAFVAGHRDSTAGAFVIAELYDLERRSVAETGSADTGRLEALLDRRKHAFPTGGEALHDHVWLDHRIYMRVVVPLADAAQPVGFFEGVFKVPETRLAEMRAAAFRIVISVIIAVLGTTLFLLPVILLLNRRLLAHSRSLLRANFDALELLGSAIAKRDSDTHHHNFRVTIYAVSLAAKLNLPKATIQELIKGAFLHDVGKIAIPDSILLKPGKLTDDEFAVMKTHVDHGVDIVSRSHWMAGAAPVVHHHHEKFDGSGYPDRLTGENIPITARIFAIADVFDALTSKRPYKEPIPLEQALAMIEAGRGTHFDPRLVDVFIAIAPALYEAYGRQEDPVIEATLAARAAQYFGL